MAKYGGKELAAAHRTVRGNTIQIVRDIPEDKLDFVPAPGARSLRQLIAHIALTSRVQEDFHRTKRITTLKGYDFPGFVGQLEKEEQVHRSKDELIAMLESEGENFASWLETLTPEFLDETFSDPSGQFVRTRFEGLLSPKEHEMHHRGQLMLIQRMLGVTPHLTRERQQRMSPPAATPQSPTT